MLLPVTSKSVVAELSPARAILNGMVLTP